MEESLESANETLRIDLGIIKLFVCTYTFTLFIN